MKIHLFSIFKYLLGFVFILLFIWLFEQDYLVYLLFPYILLPVILLPAFFLNYKKLTFRGYSSVQSVVAGSPIKFAVEYNNPTVLPFSKCAFMFTVKNLYYENKYEHILNMVVHSKKKSSVEIPVDTEKLGMVSFESSKIHISDFLGFITVIIPLNIKVEVPVLPNSKVEVEDLRSSSAEGFDEYSEPDMKGNLSSDVKEIREYRPGDRLQRVHWKLSAKLDDLFVKEMDRTSVMSLVVLPELAKDSIETTITYLDSIARDLYSVGERFEICLFNSQTCEFNYYMIDSEEAMYNCYMSLYYLPLYDIAGMAKDSYYASSQKSSMIVSINGGNVKLLEDGIEVV